MPVRWPGAKLEIKHFLSSETEYLQVQSRNAKMINEIIDISQKEIKAIMTPRQAVVAEDAGHDLRRIVLEKNISKVPIYRGRPDQITGVVHTRSDDGAVAGEHRDIRVRELASPPIFVSEYSSLHYILNEIQTTQFNTSAVVLDEYGTPQGRPSRCRTSCVRFSVRSTSVGGLFANWRATPGSCRFMPVEEVNERLDIELPERRDYTTISGLFVYHYGRLRAKHARVQVGNPCWWSRRWANSKN